MAQSDRKIHVDLFYMNMKNNNDEIGNLQIGDRLIGPDQPTYIIAEVGINHNGDIKLAKELVDAAIDAKVNAVKFQKRDLPRLYNEEVLNHTTKFEQNFQYMIPILKEVELSEEDMAELHGYCVQRGIEFICTPFDENSAYFINGLGVNVYKIASADLTNLGLIEFVSSFGKPMIISTGMSYWKEIEKSVSLLKRLNIEFALLHCRSSYPVWPREVNLKMINKLKTFGCPVGYSGHDIGITIPLVAASMGASIIEKHITLDKKMSGPDHKISLEPFEFKRLVRDIRVSDQAMGSNSRFLLRGEILNRELFGKSLVAAGDILKGSRITADMIITKGPGKGLPPNRKDDLVGLNAKRNIQAGDFFIEEDVSVEQNPEDFNDLFNSRWGLIARFSDFEDMLEYHPKIIEFHFTNKDLDLKFHPEKSFSQGLIVHAPEYIGDRLLDLCSNDNEIRQASVEQIQRSVDLCKEISVYFKGLPKVIAHPGAMSLNTKLDKNSLRQNLIKSLTEIDDKGTEVILENLPPYPWYFGGQWKGNYFMNPEEIRDFCEETGTRICMDVSHAALYCNAKNIDLYHFISVLKPYVRHIHFADAYGLDGEGVQIGEGDIDFEEIMPLFDDYRETWVPEIWRGHLNQGKGFIKALSKLKKYNF